ncbi:MAG: hypothetical protein AAB339_06635, partial [Elusimicrobiota bacterium]
GECRKQFTVKVGTVFEHADDTVAADLRGHVKARLLQLVGHARGGLHFLEGDFRVGVEVLVEFEQARVFRVHAGADGGLDVCGGELKVLKARDLYGAEVVVGRKCTHCGFRMDRDNLVPRRYIFRRFA